MALTRVSKAISEYIAQNTILGRWSSGSGEPQVLTLSENFTTSGGVFAPSGLLRILQGTPVATTSGTAIDFTGIPSWAKEITVLFNGVSTNGTSTVQVQLGTSSGIEVASYLGNVSGISTGVSIATHSTGFFTNPNNIAANIVYGSITLTHNSSNFWACFGGLSGTNAQYNLLICGGKQLSSILDRLRITTVNGTDTFDAGSVNILVKG